MPCTRCQQLPTLDRSPGRLFLWFPLGHTRAKACRAIEAAGFRRYDGQGEQVVVDIPDGRPEIVATAIAAALAELEANDTRCLFKPGAADATIADITDLRSLRAFVRLYTDDWFLDLLKHDRLRSAYQPIVRAQDSGHVLGHEALVRARMRDGTAISPLQLFDEARETGLMVNLDLACRSAAIRGAGDRGIGTPAGGMLFINFSPTSIYDPSYCLKPTIAAIDAASMPHDCIVFEVIESERSVDIEHLQKILSCPREAGFKVALDDVGAGYSSLNLLHQLRPDFVKLDMELVRGVDRDRYKAVIASKLLETANELGIQTIAEGIETDGELTWVSDHGATFAQGFLIGRPI